MEIKKIGMRNIKRGLLLVSIPFLLWSATKVNDYFEWTKNLEIFTSVYKEINLKYVDRPNPGELMKIGVDAMLSSLDPYTNFYTESQVEEALILRKGDFGTAGFELNMLQNKLLISKIIPGTEAEKYQLQLGDELLEVNGRAPSPKSVSAAYEALEGAAGSKVSLKLKRQNDTLAIDLLRVKPSFNNVPYYGMVNSGVAYIKLDQFMENSAEEVKKALLELKSKHNPKSLILDLRNNGGGLLVDAVRIVNLFVPQNKVLVVTKGRTEEHYREYRTMEPPVDLNIGLVVLINKNSASASEIVAGSIQDLDRGIVLGQNSFGKGLVQNQLTIPYRHQLKVTIAKYYIPSGRCIQKIEYGQKNKLGKDSTAAVFYTQNKRKVMEGNGIKPDVALDRDEDNAFLKEIKNSGALFEFAIQEASKYSKADFGSAAFKLKNNTLPDFENFLKGRNFVFELPAEKMLSSLEENLKREGMAEKEIKQVMAEFANKIAAYKNKAIEQNKEEITTLLAIEIARTIMGEQDRYPVLFQYDKEILKAVEVLENKQLYQNTLKP